MALETMRQLKKMKKDYEAKISSMGKQAANELIASFFTKNKDVKAIRWAQYTPYFNDGDTCEFGMYDVEVSFDAKHEGDEDGTFYEMHDYGDCAIKESGKPVAYIKELEKRIGKFQEKRDEVADVFEHAFGDHVQVTVYNDQAMNISVDSYEHD